MSGLTDDMGKDPETVDGETFYLANSPEEKELTNFVSNSLRALYGLPFAVANGFGDMATGIANAIQASGTEYAEAGEEVGKSVRDASEAASKAAVKTKEALVTTGAETLSAVYGQLATSIQTGYEAIEYLKTQANTQSTEFVKKAEDLMDAGLKQTGTTEELQRLAKEAIYAMVTAATAKAEAEGLGGWAMRVAIVSALLGVRKFEIENDASLAGIVDAGKSAVDASNKASTHAMLATLMLAGCPVLGSCVAATFPLCAAVVLALPRNVLTQKFFEEVLRDLPQQPGMQEGSGRAEKVIKRLVEDGLFADVPKRPSLGDSEPSTLPRKRKSMGGFFVGSCATASSAVTRSMPSFPKESFVTMAASALEKVTSAHRRTF